MANRELRRVQEKSKASAQKTRQAAQRKRASERKKGEKKGLKGAWKSVVQFLKDVRIELKKVIWPNKQEVINYTLVVLITVTIVATYVLVIDYGLQRLLTYATSSLFK